MSQETATNYTPVLFGLQQENLIALLIQSYEHGKIVAELVNPQLFEGDYRVIAERCIAYWRRYGKPPGAAHIGDIMEPPPRGRKVDTFNYTILSLLELAQNGINSQYVLDALRHFTRAQQCKIAILKAAEVLAADHTDAETSLATVEAYMSDILHAHVQTFEAGLAGDDLEHLFKHLEAREHPEFLTGIPLLDYHRVVPERGTLSILLGTTGAGKSWWLQYIGRQALMLRKRVLHVTLELSDTMTQQRYLQSFLALAALQKDKVTMRPELKLDGKGALIAIGQKEVTARFALQNQDGEEKVELKKFIRKHYANSHNRYARLKIKKFPTRGLTVRELRGFLTGLETMGFLPDLLLLDYVGIMQTDSDNYRISLGRVVEELRGLAVERNIAVMTAQQASKAGQQADRVDITHVAEDWSIVGTADFVLTLTRTETEKRHKLARLWVAKSRESSGETFGVVLAQNYAHGQFALDTAPLDGQRYADILEALDDNKQQERE